MSINDLEQAMATVMERDAARFRRRVDEVIDPLDRADRLRAASGALESSMENARG